MLLARPAGKIIFETSGLDDLEVFELLMDWVEKTDQMS